MNRPPVWQVVLYGRTLRADSWWRVRPYDIDVAWLNALVIATAGGGEDLGDGPRMLLARRGERVLVGAASRAAMLSQTMNSDGSRPLYCFVGWLSGDRDIVVPSLDAFKRCWVTWAAEAYEAWMLLDWNRHPSDLTRAHEPPLEVAPWADTSTDTTALPSAGGTRRQHRGQGIITVPTEEWAGAWAGLLASPGDFAITGPFQRPIGDSSGVLTHVVAADRYVDQPGEPSHQPTDPVPEALSGSNLHTDQRLSQQPLQPGWSRQEATQPPEPTYQREDSQAPMQEKWAHDSSGVSHSSARNTTPAEPHRLVGALKKKVSRTIKSIATMPESPGYEDPPKTDDVQPEGAQHGPSANLDYWVTHSADPLPEKKKKRPLSRIRTGWV